MVEIREAKSTKEKKAFIDFQNSLYKNVPQYVPTMMMDELQSLNEKKNPAFEYCQMKLFLAYKNDQLVGRTAAILSNKANKKFDRKRLRISRIDFIDDYEVSSALIDAVTEWAKELGMNELSGPLGCCDLDKEGMLIEGFEQPSMFITYYNFPYYKDHFEKLGFTKDVDWIENRVYTEALQPEKLDRLCERIKARLGVKVFHLNSRAEIVPYVEKVLGLVNEAFRHLYSVVELSQRQMEYYAQQFLPLINPDYLVLVEKDSELIAAGLLGPSLAEPMKKSNGRLFPFGFIPLLNAIKHPKVLDMYLVAVKDEYLNSGLPALLMNDMLKIAQKNGVEYAETGPELETNFKVRGLWNYFKCETEIRRRRSWKKSID